MGDGFGRLGWLGLLMSTARHAPQLKRYEQEEKQAAHAPNHDAHDLQGLIRGGRAGSGGETDIHLHIFPRFWRNRLPEHSGGERVLGEAGIACDAHDHAYLSTSSVGAQKQKENCKRAVRHTSARMALLT